MVSVGEGVQVGAGAEELRTIASDHQHTHARLVVQAFNGLLQVMKQTFWCEGVCRWALERYERDRAVLQIVQMNHHVSA